LFRILNVQVLKQANKETNKETKKQTNKQRILSQAFNQMGYTNVNGSGATFVLQLWDTHRNVPQDPKS